MKTPKETFQEGWICDPENQAGVLLLFEKIPAFSESKKSKNLQVSI